MKMEDGYYGYTEGEWHIGNSGGSAVLMLEQNAKKRKGSKGHSKPGRPLQRFCHLGHDKFAPGGSFLSGKGYTRCAVCSKAGTSRYRQKQSQRGLDATIC